LCERLRDSTGNLSDHAFLTVRARLFKKITAFAIGYRQDGPDGLKINVRLPQREIAYMIGVTRGGDQQGAEEDDLRENHHNAGCRIVVKDMRALSEIADLG
jgi:hypothetical protein